MARLILRVSVILLLLMTVGSLVLGILLFQQRETLKGRTQKLEQAVKQVAGTIEAGDDTDKKLLLPDEQLKTFKAVPGGPKSMDAPLSQLADGAKKQLARLNQTRDNLSDTKTKLGQTEDELKTTKKDLDSTKETVKEQNGTIAAKTQEIETKDSTIKTLENEKKDMASKNGELQEQIDSLETEKRDLTDEVAALKEKVEQQESQIDPRKAKDKLAKGKTGQILYINPDWNFVVIGIADEFKKSVMPDIELLVHRRDKLIGKVRVATVIDNMVIGEIITDWQQLPFIKGDDVIY